MKQAGTGKGRVITTRVFSEHPLGSVRRKGDWKGKGWNGIPLAGEGPK